MLQTPEAMACALLFWLLLFTALATPSQGKRLGPTPRLRYSRFLDPSNAVFLRWDFDFEAEIITFELQVRTAGWVGLGVTNRYSRAGSDLVVGGVLPDGNVYFSVSLRVAPKHVGSLAGWRMTLNPGRIHIFQTYSGTGPEHQLMADLSYRTVHWRG